MRLTKSVMFVVGMTIGASAWAADATIKYRQSQMAALGGHMSSIAALVKKEVPLTDQLAAHTQGLAATAAFTASVFKERAQNKKSASKSEIWTDWDRFATDADALQDAANLLAQAVAANDQAAIRKYTADASKTCKSCHDDFKVKNVK